MNLPDDARRWRVAAGVYAAYGVVYLTGAVLNLTPERMTTFFGFVPWWAFYVAGLGLVVGLPVLVWKRYRWFTRILTLGPAIKALMLCWRQGRRLSAGEPLPVFDWVFMTVAMVAAGCLAWASWRPRSAALSAPEHHVGGD
jgi:hypothetical protein